MAEIPVVQKPRSRAAPFVILLIVLLVIAGVWYWWSSQPTVTQTGSVPVAPILEVV